MSGINSLKSKLKKLGDETKIEKRKRSVITYSEYAEIEKAGVWPDDVNEGILLVPDKMTMEEWKNADFTKEKIKKASQHIHRTS